MKKSPVTKVLSVALLAIGLAFALALSGCSSSEPAASGETTPEDPEYVVQIFVDCEQNLIFSKYDVDVMVDGKDVGNVEHGGEATFEVSLAKGQHELVFEKEGESEPDGKTSFVVEGEGDKFSYRISCTSSQIEIESIKEEEENKAEEEEAAKKKQEEEAAAKKKQEEEAKKEAAKSSKYEYAYVRRMSSYDCYYLIDLDEMTATSFTTEESPMVMPCTGNLESGLTIDYVNDGFQEHLKYKTPGNDKVVILHIGDDDFDWEYEKADVAEAEAVLASVS